MIKNQIPLLLAFLLPALAHAQMRWPEGKSSAIVLTYDDGLETHRNIVVPQLKKAGIKATFFLYGLTLSETDIPEWKKISDDGHELGNHSLYHPCLGDENSQPCQSLEYYTIPSILREIALMNQFLYAIDGDTNRTYAYPCGDTTAGGEDYSGPLGQSGLIRFSRGGEAATLI